MRDCALVLYKYAILFVPECGVPRQVVQRLSIGPAPSGAFPLVRVRCRPGALLLLFFFLPMLFIYFFSSPCYVFSNLIFVAIIGKGVLLVLNADLEDLWPRWTVK